MHFYHQLMRDIRESILADRFLELYREKREFLQEPDADNPIRAPRVSKKKRALARGDYEVHIAREGFASIRHVGSGEIMHSRVAPMQEARRLYIEQAKLAERIREESSEELVIWDVGLGAAANAMSAIGCYEEQAKMDQTQRLRPLSIVSFENDLDSLRLALALTDLFPYLRHSGPPGILKNGHWESRQHPGLRWSVIAGDFLQTVSEAEPPPDLIFYDMFSSKMCGAHWTRETFEKVFLACQGRPVELFTYSCSTSVRVALLAAGFYVARGWNTGAKEETTVALTPSACADPSLARHDLLSSEWLEKWKRSKAKFPSALPLDERRSFEQMILAHEQFRISALPADSLTAAAPLSLRAADEFSTRS